MSIAQDAQAAIEAQVANLKQRIETAKTNFAGSAVAADLAAIEAAVDQLVTDVRAAIATLRDPGTEPQPATEA